MTVEEFDQISTLIQPYTNYIYLHVLGEPFLHPDFRKIVETAQSKNININLSTNASLLAKHIDFLTDNPLRQINFSLHDAEENIPEEKWGDYILMILKYAEVAAPDTYINMRLWNSQMEASHHLNRFFLGEINRFFGLNLMEEEVFATSRSIKIADHIFLDISTRFEWPDGVTQKSTPKRTCYALRDHIAILTDGTVVPCCIDAEAQIPLGNIFRQSIDEMIGAPRAIALKTGLQNNYFTEEICKTCGFINGN